MNKLECQVTTCRYNCDNLCSLPGIRVDGPAARESSQTCCESYEERQQGSPENAVSGSASTETDIECKAEHCAYNHDCRCEAECVCVGCCCSEPTSKSGTECCTFRQE